MNKKEAAEILDTISHLYPDRFKLTEPLAKFWIVELMEMDHKRVMQKLRAHVVTNKYVPTLADIAAFGAEKNKTFEQMDQWDKEAEKVPKHVKQKFANELSGLLRRVNK